MDKKIHPVYKSCLFFGYQIFIFVFPFFLHTAAVLCCVLQASAWFRVNFFLSFSFKTKIRLGDCHSLVHLFTREAMSVLGFAQFSLVLRAQTTPVQAMGLQNLKGRKM